ncbi:FAD-dependent monooxygenase [Melittangium boletus]|uniref:FAD-dependent monooxygenase n=1 Tax=Melittangium boletus TaxID=83453 RepID=UPI003DA334F0
MTSPSILIAGASIAGPVLAYWLRRYGMNPVVVERAPDLRLGGQTVDLRGAGKDVVYRMGLERQVHERTTREEGIHFLDESGQIRASLGADDFGGEGPIAGVEILRGELASMLYEHTRHETEYLFGDRVESLHQEDDKVQVRLLNGGERTFDLVIAADGTRSKTRDLVFGAGTELRFLGGYAAYFTIPRVDSDGTWARACALPDGRSVLLRPDNLGTTRALLTYLSSNPGHDKLDPRAQKDMLQRLFAHAGWETPRVLAEMEHSPDFYLQGITQIRMPCWSRGRVAVVGDAAYAPSGVTGMGTTLALVGAYILAGELARYRDSHQAAFASYEALMRPYVTRTQHLPPGIPRLANPRTRLGIKVFHSVLRSATHPLVTRALGKVLRPPADTLQLPDYSALDRRAAAFERAEDAEGVSAGA